MKKLFFSMLFAAAIGCTTTGFASTLSLDGLSGASLDGAPEFNAIVSPFSYSGTTTGGPTFNRPNAVGTATPTALSAVGTAVPYDVVMFTVAVSGTYSFLSTSTTTGYDNYTLLYSGVFNPATPLTGVLQGNDDIIFGVTSGFSRALTSGTQYSFVTTGYANTNFGTFTDTITLVPEPSTWALLIVSAAGLVAWRRFRPATV